MFSKGYEGFCNFYKSLINTNTRSSFAGNLIRILDACQDPDEKILISEYDNYGLFKALCEIEDGKLLDQYLCSLDKRAKLKMIEQEIAVTFEEAARKKVLFRYRNIMEKCKRTWLCRIINYSISK